MAVQTLSLLFVLAVCFSFASAISPLNSQLYEVEAREFGSKQVELGKAVENVHNGMGFTSISSLRELANDFVVLSGIQHEDQEIAVRVKHFPVARSNSLVHIHEHDTVTRLLLWS